VAEFDEIDVKR